MALDLYLRVLCLSVSIACIKAHEGHGFGAQQQYYPNAVATGGRFSSSQLSSYEPTSNKPISAIFESGQTTNSLSSAIPVAVTPASSNLWAGYQRSGRDPLATNNVASSERFKDGFGSGEHVNTQSMCPPRTSAHTRAAFAAGIPIPLGFSQSGHVSDQVAAYPLAYGLGGGTGSHGGSAQGTGALPYYTIPSSYSSAPGLPHVNYGSGSLHEMNRYAYTLLVPSQGVGSHTTSGSAQTLEYHPYSSIPQVSYASTQGLDSQQSVGSPASYSYPMALGSHTNLGLAHEAGAQLAPPFVRGSSVLTHGLSARGSDPSWKASGYLQGPYTQLGSGPTWVPSGLAPPAAAASQERCGFSLPTGYRTRHGFPGSDGTTQTLASQLTSPNHPAGYSYSPGMNSQGVSTSGQVLSLPSVSRAPCNMGCAQTGFSGQGTSTTTSLGVGQASGSQSNPGYQNLVSQVTSGTPYVPHMPFQGTDWPSLPYQVAVMSYGSGSHVTPQPSYESTRDLRYWTRNAFPQRYGMQAISAPLQQGSGSKQILSPLGYGFSQMADPGYVQGVQSQFGSALVSSVPSSPGRKNDGCNVGQGSQARYGSTLPSVDHRSGDSPSTFGLVSSPTLQKTRSQMSFGIPLPVTKQGLVVQGFPELADTYTAAHSLGSHRTTGSNHVSAGAAHTRPLQGSMSTGSVSSSQEAGNHLAIAQQMASHGISSSGQGVGSPAQTSGFQLRAGSAPTGWASGSQFRKYWQKLLPGQGQ
ncbi:uncharacterized protein LOC108928954 [Scleropages formosus]|uniref:uncharacterized protein LOC108928954 n=1 Tax=Scleropages formosus TaxID=113540 RepID=UPI0010FA793E|nr:uncharacterized protein LOC108928954 [Scleropages formosus]